MFVRRSEMPRINPIRFMENAGFLRHFADLDDAEKYRGMDFFLSHSQPPTNDTYQRAAACPGFSLHLGEPWVAVRQAGEQVKVTTPLQDHHFDFIIASTGLMTNVALRPELSAVAGDIAHWRDRYLPPPGLRNRLIDDHPYLGPAFEFLPNKPEAADRLHGLFAFNYSALVSLGLSAAALSGMKYAAPPAGFRRHPAIVQGRPDRDHDRLPELRRTGISRMKPTGLTTHVLDTARGHAAAGMRVEVRHLAGGASTSAMLDDQGRAALLPELEPGAYEVLFHAGAYQAATAPFYDVIPVRFNVTEPAAHYHIPLILSPYGYSTYRGG